MDANRNDPKAMSLELYNGLEKLSKLALYGSPRTPNDIEALREIWWEALDMEKWCFYPAVDTPRWRKAFNRLAGGQRISERDRSRFPNPLEFLEAMPRPAALEADRQIEFDDRALFRRKPVDWARLRRLRDEVEAATSVPPAKTADYQFVPPAQFNRGIGPAPEDPLERLNWLRAKRGKAPFDSLEQADAYREEFHRKEREALERMGLKPMRHEPEDASDGESST